VTERDSANADKDAGQGAPETSYRGSPVRQALAGRRLRPHTVKREHKRRYLGYENGEPPDGLTDCDQYDAGNRQKARKRTGPH
jgi:hypothetical protein